MTSDTKYKLEEYLQLLKMDSAVRHLLVEGKDDRNAFEILFEILLQESDRDDISIHIAETLIEIDNENRNIVEIVCAEVINREYYGRFAGFVDREFRGFRWDPELDDDIQGHRVIDRLVWSRGHSIENYFLDADILRSPFLTVCPNGFRHVSAKYNSIFNSLIQVACAIGLAAKGIQRLNRVRSTIDDSIVTIAGHNITIDLEVWRAELEDKLLVDEVEDLLNRYDHWNTIVRNSDIGMARWLCDGHIAFKLVWAAYEKCLSNSNHRLSAPPKLSMRLNMCAKAWADEASLGRYIYPVELFKLLDLVEHLQD